MLINRFFGFCALLALVGCGGVRRDSYDWSAEYGTYTTGTPVQMQYGTYNENETDTLMSGPHRMAVLLPLTGDNAAVGGEIRTAVEMAVLQSAPQNLSVEFYDVATNTSGVIDAALATNPEIIIGPVFADNARMLRDFKDESIPALAFTTDETAIGDGVMTMSLMPNNGVEAIVKQMLNDGVKRFIILAPETESGALMAGVAEYAADIYNMPVSGIFYYAPGDTESIKSSTVAASMNVARVAALNRAREIVSDILTNEQVNILEQSSLMVQLDTLSKQDALGALPYDAILMLGAGDDAKSIMSFMRYYGVGARDARVYGTALWDGDVNVARDFTLSGARYPALPEMSPKFIDVFERVSGAAPSRLAAFGYDAANMAIGMLYSDKSDAAYLLDPSGYVGANGLVRLRPAGMNERALRIMQLNGTDVPREIVAAPSDFMRPLYNIEQRHIRPADTMELESDGITPTDYINIPDRLRDKYKSKTYGANTSAVPMPMPVAATPIKIAPDERDAIVSPDFTPVKLTPVNRTYIDSVEIYEE